MRRLIGLTAAIGVAGFAAASWAQQSSAFNGVDEIVVEDFIGTVKITVAQNASVGLVRTNGANAGYPVSVDKAGAALTVKSDTDPDTIDWWKDVHWRVDQEKAFDNFLKDYPTLEFTVPPGTNVRFDSAVIRLSAGDTGGALYVSGGHVDGAIGDLASASINIDGSGDLKVGDVSGAMEIDIHGSGDLDIASVGSLDASIHGSGDITMGDVRGPAEAFVQGSGDIVMGNVAGTFSYGSQGSGDVEAGVIAGGVTIDVNGSSDLALKEINGETKVTINGSGDVRIDDGRAENLNVRVSGSGDFEFMGVATNPNLTSHGSGDIYVRDHEGAVTAHGDGDIRVGNISYGDDD